MIRASSSFSAYWAVVLTGSSLSLSIGCTTTIVDPGIEGSSGGASSVMHGGTSSNPLGSGGAATTAGSGGAGANGGGGPMGASGSPASGETACSGTEVTAAKRIVRLSFNQIANSIGALVSTGLSTKLVEANDILDREHRAFPPLQSPREGNSITDATWKTLDAMAADAAEYVFDDFAAITNCGANPTDACAQQYLENLARRAYRRPLTASEQSRLGALYTTALRGDAGATIQEAVQNGVYAILQSPQFVYRTEFGSDWTVDGALTPFEMASQLAYFLTDTLPDPALLDAAAQNVLSTPVEVGAQVERILTTEAARRNLHGAMMSYFAYPQLEAVKIDDPAFTDGVRNSMYHEAELFLETTLWSGKLEDILLSKRTRVNASLAQIYGVPQFPSAGAALDADGFALVELPATRMGLITQAGFLTTRSRPDKTSVVGRGLLIKNALLCSDTPDPPDSIADQIAAVTEANSDASERELANIRTTMSPCNACHLSFDAYGLSVDTYDIIGRYRTTDAKGRPIDTTVTLPEQVGGGVAKDAIEVALSIAASGGFARCMGRNLVNYALADVSAGAADISSCATERIANTFKDTDRTFSSLVKSVATSVALSTRSKGAAQ